MELDLASTDEPYGSYNAVESPLPKSSTQPTSAQPPTLLRPLKGSADDILGKTGTIVGIALGASALVCLMVLIAIMIWFKIQRRHAVVNRRLFNGCSISAGSVATQKEYPRFGSVGVPVVQPGGETCVGLTFHPPAVIPKLQRPAILVN